jgi:hypothetical protein
MILSYIQPARISHRWQPDLAGMLLASIK